MPLSLSEWEIKETGCITEPFFSDNEDNSTDLSSHRALESSDSSNSDDPEYVPNMSVKNASARCVF